MSMPRKKCMLEHHSPNSLRLGVYLRKKELATLTGRAPELCGWALCPGLVCPPLVLCGWALCPGLVLLLSSVAGLSCWALSSSCSYLGRAPELPGSVSGSCPPLVLVLAAPLNSVAGLWGPVFWRGVWPNK